MRLSCSGGFDPKVLSAALAAIARIKNVKCMDCERCGQASASEDQAVLKAGRNIVIIQLVECKTDQEADETFTFLSEVSRQWPPETLGTGSNSGQKVADPHSPAASIPGCLGLYEASQSHRGKLAEV